MNLSDTEILELIELCNGVVDGTLTEKQKARLTHWLSSSEDARQFYVRVTGLSASLCHYSGEMQTGAPETLASPAAAMHLWRWMLGVMAVAASIVLLFKLDAPKPKLDPPAIAATTAPAEVEFVAGFTGSKDCQWATGVSPVHLGGRLRKGQRVELSNGFAEITFDCGAQLLLQAPASLEVNSAWSATLNRGTLKASVPWEAIGFKISNPTVEIVDLGTEFTMFADAGGTAAEVFVLKGEVEARIPPDQQTIKLKERESRRFAISGSSNVHNSRQMFDELTQPMLLDHFVPPTGFAHWSFNETTGDLFNAKASGLDSAAAPMEIFPRSALGAARTKGRRHSALRFDGSLYAKAAFPGIAANLHRTVVFWVKVPRDAQLSSAYSMLAWGASSKNFGSHPFHIGWNRNADEGVVGVLRTDYGRGFAVGATPLRDGRWHHIAVVFRPIDDAETTMEVKQYVDGRLEGEGHPSPPGSDIFMENNTSATSGTIWLGCRLGIKGVRTERFIGEMDDLYIADRALQPHEIVELKNEEQP